MPNTSMDMERIEVVRLALWVVDVSVHTFEIPVIRHRPECLRTPGFSPVTFMTGTDSTMGTVEKKR